MVRRVLVQALDGRVEVEQQRPLAVVTHHALNPEERGDPRAARHRPDGVQARRRIEDQVSGRQLHRVHAVGVFDEQSPPSYSSGALRNSVAERSVRMRWPVR